MAQRKPGVVLYVRIPAELHEQIRERSEEYGVSAAAFTARAIEWYLIEKLKWTGDPTRSLP